MCIQIAVKQTPLSKNVHDPKDGVGHSYLSDILTGLNISYKSISYVVILFTFYIKFWENMTEL